jgi:O-antigen/teichoic acid export membrane protein
MLEDKKFLLKGTVINALGLIAKLLGPVLVVLMARLFSQVEFGLFMSIQYFTMTLSRVAVLGLDKGLIWYLPYQKKEWHAKPFAKKNQYIGVIESLRMAGVLAVLLTLICFIFLSLGGLALFPNLKEIDPISFLVCIFSTIPLTVLHVCAGAMEGVRHPEYKVVINQFLVAILGPLLSICFHYIGMGFLSMFMGFTIGNLLGAFLFWFLIRKYFSLTINPLSRKVPQRLLAYSLPLGVSEIANGLLLRADLWMILILLGPKEAAIYSVMLILVNALKTVRQGFDPLIVPVVSEMDQKKIQTELPTVFSYATNMVSTIQTGIALFILLFPGEILNLAGKSYAVEFQALAILIVGNVISGFFDLNGMVLLGLGKSKVSLVFTVGALLANIVVNYFLINHYGISGAAIGTVLVLILQNVAFLVVQYRRTRTNPYQKNLLYNSTFVILLVGVIIMYYDTLSILELYQRVQFFVVSILLFLGFIWLNRSSYRVN